MAAKSSPTSPARRGSPFAWLVLAINLALTAGYIFFSLRNGPGHFDWSSLAFAGFPLTGALVMYHQPRNRVGWALALFGFLNILSNSTREYGYYGLITQPGSLPLSDFVAWVSSWSWLAAQPFAIAIILLFPDGSPPSRRWRALIGIVFAIIVPVLIHLSILFWSMRGIALVREDIQSTFTPAALRDFTFIISIWNPIYIVGIVLAVIAMGIRFARSRGIERQQLKWIFLAMSIVPVSVAVGPDNIPKNIPLLLTLYNIFNVVSILGFPITVSIAITRYHLYDIDVIIRRTLLYAALTVTLSLLYFGSVILFQAIITRVTGSQSPVSVVLSTLLIAALFSPLRAGFQRVIDRRFYRGKYNSELVIERFTAGLRTDVDLDSIHQHLVGVVDESLQPDFSDLWLVSPREAKL